MTLITELIVNCDELAQERFDPNVNFDSQQSFADRSPVKPIFIELWPHLKQIMMEFTQLEKLMEVVTRLINKFVHVLPFTFLDCVEELIQIVISKFEMYPHSAFIFSLETSFKEYHHYTRFQPIFLKGYEAVTQRCMRLMSTKQQIEEYPLVASDFFILTQKYMVNNKSLYF